MSYIYTLYGAPNYSIYMVHYQDRRLQLKQESSTWSHMKWNHFRIGSYSAMLFDSGNYVRLVRNVKQIIAVVFNIP